MITPERLREVLSYDQETGIFTWRLRLATHTKIGKSTGCPDTGGYLCIRIDGRLYTSHRLAWLYVTGNWPKDDIDHIDGDKRNNRFENLREATHAQNMQNFKRAAKTSRSGLIGVSYHGGKFQSEIRLNGVRHFLGTFPTPEAAHAAYIAAKRELHPFSTL